MSLFTRFELDRIRDEIKEECLTLPGQRIMMAVEPSFSPIEIRRRRNRLEEAMDAQVRFGAPMLEGTGDPESLLNQASKGRVLTAQELLQVLKLIRTVRTVREYENNLKEIPHEELHDLFSTLIIHEALERKIADIINDYGEVKDSASPALKDIRRQLRSADQRIAEAVEQFRSSHAESMVDSIVTVRNGRTVLLVRVSDKNRFGGIVYGDSQSHQASYIEPSSLMRANNRKLELQNEEEEEIARILAVISQEVTAKAEEELSNVETLAILDDLFAKASWGVKNHACAANLNEEKRFTIRQARHPLISEKDAVKNDYHLQDPYHTLLITGPNTGGKTVSMKIFGLFTLMTYCGMPVTAEEADIPFFDRVFADIGDDQSVASSLSSFSAHVEKQAEMLREATEHSLILLDEIGSGTDPREGESLAIAILNELRKRQATVIATTHYSRLKAYGRRHDDILVATVEFDFKTLRPTYRYLEGITGESNALSVAERCGLPSGVISYARFLKQQSKTDEEGMMERLEKQLMEAEQKNRKLEESLAKIKEYQKTLEEEHARIASRREELLDEARGEAEEIVEHAREEADAILKDLRNSSKSAKYHELLKQKTQLDTINAAAAKEVRSSPDDFREGDTVELRSSGAVARIVSIRKKEIVILLNGREVKVKPAQIRPSLKRLPKEKAPEQQVSSFTVPDSVPMECNLIGLYVDEAREELLDYMDSAKLARLKTFRIIHGDGSGALRKMVQELLAKDSSVDSYRYGMPNEGGTGATVVTMKD
ncbi:MAG: Smr/MutS family protein [Solobacterium sp.]|nr:Smr/MutS family protein [Solobacterium sp.]